MINCALLVAARYRSSLKTSAFGTADAVANVASGNYDRARNRRIKHLDL